MWQMLGVGLLVVSTHVMGSTSSDELGYLDPVGGVPWKPPVRVDYEAFDKEAAAEAKERELGARERCIKRSGTMVAKEMLMCANRQTMTEAMRHAGAVLLKHSGPKDVFLYNASQLWPGSAYASIGFTGQRFAVIDIAYPPIAGWFDQLYMQLAKSHGKPKRIEGSANSARGVMWQQGDSIQIWLHQPDPSAVLISYVRPDMYRYWSRSRAEGKK